jgi:hypothetical protein
MTISATTATFAQPPKTGCGPNVAKGQAQPAQPRPYRECGEGCAPPALSLRRPVAPTLRARFLPLTLVRNSTVNSKADRQRDVTEAHCAQSMLQRVDKQKNIRRISSASQPARFHACPQCGQPELKRAPRSRAGRLAACPRLLATSQRHCPLPMRCFVEQPSANAILTINHPTKCSGTPLCARLRASC